jgi:hypothetical protein
MPVPGRDLRRTLMKSLLDDWVQPQRLGEVSALAVPKSANRGHFVAKSAYR